MPIPKRILISHVYSSDNKGDAALTSVLIKDLKRKFPTALITILTLEPHKNGGQFDGVTEKPSFMYWALNKYRNPLLKLGYVLFMMITTLAWALGRGAGLELYLPRHLRQVAKLYEAADLIVPVGGGYIRSRKGLLNRFNVPLLLHPLLFGYFLDKPTVLYSQSVGPFQNILEQWAVAFVLRRMALVLLREDTSVALLKRLRVTKNVQRAVDSGFLLKSTTRFDVRAQYGVPKNKLLIGVTVRAWLAAGRQSAYEQAVASALDTLIEKENAHVLFVPQVTASKGDDDRLVSQKVYALMKHKQAVTVIDDAPDHHHIKAIYDGLDVLLGTRFHSVIFSLTSYVPVLAIEYEHKTSGIMRDLQLDDWVIKIEHATSANLTAGLQKLVNSRPKYKAHLRRRLPVYIRQAERTADMLAQSYYDFSLQR